MYTFSSSITFVEVLTQKNDEGNRFPISFMSSELQGENIDYPKVEKQAYVVLK
jgi:hypothetical protein